MIPNQIVDFPGVDIIHEAYNFDELIFIDYLGVKDMCGKKIFNHDIVFFDGNYYTISREGFKVTLNNKNNDFATEIDAAGIDCSDLKVVGNIFQTPELLKQKSAC